MEHSAIVLHIPTTAKFASLNKLNRKLAVLTCLRVGESPNSDINRPGHGRQSMYYMQGRLMCLFSSVIFVIYLE